MAMAGRSSVYTGFKHDLRGQFVFYWQNPSVVNGTVCLILRVVLNQWPNNNQQTQAIDTGRHFTSAAMTSMHSGLVTTDEVQAAQQKDRR